MNINELTIKEAHQKLLNKDFSSEELTKACLSQMDNVDTDINAFVTRTDDIAIKQAKEVDKKIQAGEKIHVLEGIPCSLKDVFCTKGIKTTASSKMLENYIPPYDSFAVKKLNESGMVIVGKVNTDEFTMGASTETSYFGVTKNPWNQEYVSGGSSGGSAASVSANECLYSLGTDTGGSIRQPAGFCGAVGLKVTYGRVSRYGVMSMASSLDTIGPITKSVEDSAIVLSAIAGQDKNDSTTPDIKVDDYVEYLNKDIRGLKVGVPKEYFIDGLDSEVKMAIEKNIKNLESLGAEIVEISLPHTKYAVAVYYIISPSEVSSNMSRYDGVRYGVRNPESNDLIDQYFNTRADGFGNEVKRRIMIGAYALSAGYVDAYYKKAQKVRTLIRQDFEKAFEKVDVIITPTSPTPAFKIGENSDDPLKMYLADIFTAPTNLAGIPGISIPSALSSGGLPIGVQLLAKHFDEKTLLQTAHQLEQVIGFDKSRLSL